MKTPKLFLLIWMSFFTMTFLHAQNPSEGCIDLNQIDSSAVCNLIYNPVCGCDSVTYENDCVAETYGGVTSFTWGVCPNDTIQDGCIDSNLIDNNIACIEIYDPVCGCDNDTYENACIAENHYGITSYTFGECESNGGGTHSNCIDSSFINPNLNCTAIYEPVCGCDGITYGNACVATTQYGVIASTPGVCSTTSIENLNGFNSISIYPNPASNLLNVRIKNLESLNTLKIHLYDFSGKKILINESIKQDKITIPLHHLSSGIYFLQISNKLESLNKKIIIKP